jgi:hypothetical protein
MNNNFLDTENFKYLINFVFNDIKQKTNNDISNNNKYITIFKRLVQTIHEKNMNKRVTKEYLNNLVIDKCVPFIIKQLNKENNNNNSRFLQQNPLGISQRPMSSGQHPMSSGQHPMSSGQHPMSSGQHPNNDFSHLTLSSQNKMVNNVVNNISGIASRNGEKIDYSTRFKEFQEDRSYSDDSLGRPNKLKSVNEIIGENTNNEAKIDYMKKMQELQNERNYDNQNNSMNEFQQSTNIENIRHNEQLQEVNNQNVEIDNSFLQQLYENNTNNDNDDNDNIDINSLNKLSTNYLDADNIDSAYGNVNNLKMNIIDKSDQNKLPEYDSNIENLKEEYKSENITANIKNSEKELYQATKKFNKIPAHLLVLENHFTNNSEDVSFTANLIEPLIIDKPCDVFLEFINLQNIDDDGGHLELVNCFALQIDELNIKTSSNNQDLNDKYIIPNDSFGTTDSGAEGATTTDATSYNIKLKSNYICTINPIELSSLNIKLYSLKISTLSLLQSQADGKVILGLFLKKHK